MSHIAFIEDDSSIRSTVQIGLKINGLRVKGFSTAEEFISHASEIHSFDLIIVDLTLPGKNGLSLCEYIRAADAFKPIIVLTATVDESTAVSAFAKGADDFIRKPFGMEELYARIQRLLGRGISQKKLSSFEGLHLDRTSRKIRFQNESLELSNREFAILTMLIESAGEVVPRERMLNAIDNDVQINDRTLDSHISHVRRKLESLGASEISISPVYGHGYRIVKKQ